MNTINNNYINVQFNITLLSICGVTYNRCNTTIKDKLSYLQISPYMYSIGNLSFMLVGLYHIEIMYFYLVESFHPIKELR